MGGALVLQAEGALACAGAALFYLVKYFTKDSVKINSALSVLREARLTLDTHGLHDGLRHGPRLGIHRIAPDDRDLVNR